MDIESVARICPRKHAILSRAFAKTSETACISAEVLRTSLRVPSGLVSTKELKSKLSLMVCTRLSDPDLTLAGNDLIGLFDGCVFSCKPAFSHASIVILFQIGNSSTVRTI